MIPRQSYMLEDGERLTDAGMKAMIPMFVRGREGDSHNCGGCSMFIPGKDDGPGGCTIVQGDISGEHGTCLYWAKAKGKPPKASDAHDCRMTKSEADYVEPSSKINCSTCKFVRGNRCALWRGTVGPGDCCMAWSQR